MTRQGRLTTLGASCGGVGQLSIPLILVPINSPIVHHDAERLLGPSPPNCAELPRVAPVATVLSNKLARYPRDGPSKNHCKSMRVAMQEYGPLSGPHSCSNQNPRCEIDLVGWHRERCSRVATRSSAGGTVGTRAEVNV